MAESIFQWLNNTLAQRTKIFEEYIQKDQAFCVLNFLPSNKFNAKYHDVFYTLHPTNQSNEDIISMLEDKILGRGDPVSFLYTIYSGNNKDKHYIKVVREPSARFHGLNNPETTYTSGVYLVASTKLEKKVSEYIRNYLTGEK